MRRTILRLLLRHGAWLVPALLYLWAVLPAPRADARDLMPFPDATEYALLAMRMAAGESPLLPIGPQLYPSRYSLVFPLMLVPFAWLTRFDPTAIWWAVVVFGLAAVFLMARVGGRLLGSRLAGGLAATFFALHPQTVNASTTAMSETALVMLFFVMLGLALPLFERRPVTWSRALTLGLVLGALTLAKAPFAWWALALTLVTGARSLKSRHWPALLAIVAGGLLCLAGDLAYRWWAFGSATVDGYEYWFPPVYTELGRVFNLRYLTRPWSPSFDAPNLGYYGAMLLGRTNDFYSRYMVPCIVVAAVGLACPRRPGRPTPLLTWLMAGWAAVGVAFCLLYFFQSPRFPMLWLPVIDLLVAWGLVRMPLWEPLRRRRLLGRPLAWWGRLVTLLALAVLMRGQLLRVHGHYHLPDDPRRREAYVDQIRSLLDLVPPGHWLLTNYQLPLVQTWRGDVGPTAALHAWYLDSALMNGHIDGIWTFGLQPRSTIPTAELAGWPASWHTAPPVLIAPDLTWGLTTQELLRLLERPVYLIVVEPPVMPHIARHYDEVIRPMLESLASVQTIHTHGDVRLYRLEGRSASPEPPDTN